MSEPNRCTYCKKKIGVIDLLSSKCRCGDTFCLRHRLPEQHSCTYNFKSEVNKDVIIAKSKCTLEFPKI